MANSGLRGLAREIEELARAHPEHSRCHEIIRVCCDHLCAIARVSELQQKLEGK
jgi:hypothetical protein